MPGADTVILAFCGVRDIGLGRQSHGPLVRPARYATSIYLRDRQRVGYTRGVPALGHDMASTIDGLTASSATSAPAGSSAPATRPGRTGRSATRARSGAERVLALAPITAGRVRQAVAPDLAPGEVTPWD